MFLVTCFCYLHSCILLQFPEKTWKRQPKLDIRRVFSIPFHIFRVKMVLCLTCTKENTLGLIHSTDCSYFENYYCVLIVYVFYLRPVLENNCRLLGHTNVCIIKKSLQQMRVVGYINMINKS